MTDSSSSLLNGVRGMNGSRRFLLLGAAAAAVVLVWAVSHWAGAPTYVTLYRDLELNEAGAIGDQLTKSTIPYKLGPSGSEILVPVADVARARVALAKQGLPMNGRPGLELFDKATWGMTDFTQRVTYQRALEGELGRTIGGLRGVERAQVHLVLPTPSPLKRLERPAGASVVLTLKPNGALTPDAVSGITYIVSNAVEGLSSENVAVMDDAGHVLSVPSESGAGGLTTRQIEIQRSEEQHLADKVEELLGTVVGTGRARAQVSAQMSFDKVDRTVETFDPNGQVLQSEAKSEPAEGAASDAPGAATVVNNSYQNSHKVEQTVGSVGAVTRLTVAVLVDEKALKSGAAAANRNLSVASLEGMVRDVVGADSARGDRVTVMAVPFENAALAAVPGAGKPEKAGPDLVVIVERVSRPLVGLAALVVLLLLALQLLKPGASVLAAAAAPQSNGADGGAASRPAGNGAPVALMRNRLQAESGERPEATAQVLRAWLSESK